jgi:MFS family permease
VAASGLVRRSPGLARLLAAEAISPLGDAMATTALILHVLLITGSATAVGLLLFARAIPPLAAPVAGAVADRLRPARLLAAGWLAQAALAGLLALLLPPLGWLLAVVFALALIDTPLSAAVGRCIPAVVAGDDLVAANALRTGVREFGTVAGPPLAGLLFAVSGARLVLGLDALTFLLVIPLALRLTVPARARAGGETRPSFGRDVRAGLSFVWRTPTVLAVALGFWVVVLFTAPDDLILPFLATRTFRAGPVAVGVLLAAASAGLLAGLPLVRPVGRRLGRGAACDGAAAPGGDASALSPGWGSAAGRRPGADPRRQRSARRVPGPTRAIVAGFAVMACGNLLTAAAPWLAAAVAAQVIRGLAIPLADSHVSTYLQRTTPPDMLGRVLANVYGGVGVAAAAGYLAGGPLVDATSPRAAFVVVGCGGLAGALACAALLRRASRRPAHTSS